MRQVSNLLIVFAAFGLAAFGADARYFGGIDLGSKGTKAALFSFTQEEDGPDPHVAWGRSINTKLVSSMKEGKFTPEGVQDATDAVRTLIDEMKGEASKSGFGDVQYFVVGSSAVAKGANKEDLAESVKKATGIEMDFIDAKREGYYSLRSAVPPRRRNFSMFVDIGSGNTKLGCLVNGTDLPSFRGTEIPYGSVTVRKKASDMNPTDMTLGIKRVINENVKPAYQNESMDTPCLRNRQRLYWAGGAAWATATFTHPERADRGYVVISKHDIDSFLANLTNGTWNQKPLEYSFAASIAAVRQTKIRVKAESDRNDVMNTFVREDLMGGVSLMKAVLESSNPAVILQFVRNASFLYGYALDKFNLEGDASR